MRDSYFLALAARRRVIFLAKGEYFQSTGVRGMLLRRFFAALGQIPVDRRGGAAASPALEAAVRIIEGGDAWGIHPEGTRSPDGRLYRGRTGAVRVALQTGAPLVPVAITGTRPDAAVPWWRRRVVVEFLPPLDLSAVDGPSQVRTATDELMRRIADHTRQHYVDEYAKQFSTHTADAA